MVFVVEYFEEFKKKWAYFLESKNMLSLKEFKHTCTF